LLYRSADFRQCYSQLCDLRAYSRPGIPMLAITATVTEKMRQSIVKSLDMTGCEFVSVSPNKPNIKYCVKLRSNDIGEDLAFLISDLSLNNISAERVIVYCRSLDMCANLYIHFQSVI